MNANTILVVQCWEGDSVLVDQMLPIWRMHEVPIVLLSPADAPVRKKWPDVEYISAGQRGWSGQHTIDRQIEHWKIIADLDQEYVFYPDADSFYTDHEFPKYVYTDALFSNELSTYDFWTRLNFYAFEDDRDGERQVQVQEAARYLHWLTPDQFSLREWHQRCPYVMQPPYFFSKTVIKQMIEAAPKARERQDFPIPFIDWFWPTVARESGIEHRNWGGDGMSVPTWEPGPMQIALEMINKGGGRFIHSVKSFRIAEQLIKERWNYLDPSRRDREYISPVVPAWIEL